jgi:hypothetical protein
MEFFLPDKSFPFLFFVRGYPAEHAMGAFLFQVREMFPGLSRKGCIHRGIGAKVLFGIFRQAGRTATAPSTLVGYKVWPR